MVKHLLRMLLCSGWCVVAGVYAVSVHQLPDTLGVAEVQAQRRLRGIGSAVQVQRIDTTAIRLRGITSMSDALRRLAGVNLRDYGGAGGLKTVGVRGLGAGHTVVSYDGLCVSDDRQGQTDLQRFSIDGMASVELQTLDNADLLCPVRNLAAAVLYLKSLASSDYPAPHLSGTAALRQASFGTWNPSLLLHGTMGKFAHWSMNGEWFGAQNDYPFTVVNGTATERLHRTNSRMQYVRTEANLSRHLAGGELRIKGYAYHNARRLPGQVVLYVNENDERLVETNAYGQAYWQAVYGRWKIFAAGKWNWQRTLYDDIDAQYPGGALRQHYWQREGYATAGFSFDMGSGWHAAYAIDYAHASLNSNLKNDRHAERDTWLQSLSVRWVNDRYNITARGVAHIYVNHRQDGAAAQDARRFTPSLTASYRLLENPLSLFVRAGYKESFRMPTFTESYFYHYGDVTLRPELVRQLSTGITLQAAPARWWSVLAFTADVYANRVKDRIVSIPYNLFIWRTVNMNQVRTKGVDITWESRWKLAKEQFLVWSSNYSWQRTTDHTDSASSSYGRQLAYTPLHSGASSIAWQNPWFSVVFSLTFSSERWATSAHVAGTRLPPWQECGMGVWHTFKLPSCQIELRADGINLFDTDYEVVARYPMPGRSYKLTAKCVF